MEALQCQVKEAIYILCSQAVKLGELVQLSELDRSLLRHREALLVETDDNETRQEAIVVVQARTNEDLNKGDRLV